MTDDRNRLLSGLGACTTMGWGWARLSHHRCASSKFSNVLSSKPVHSWFKLCHDKRYSHLLPVCQSRVPGSPPSQQRNHTKVHRTIQSLIHPFPTKQGQHAQAIKRGYLSTSSNGVKKDRRPQTTDLKHQGMGTSDKEDERNKKLDELNALYNSFLPSFLPSSGPPPSLRLPRLSRSFLSSLAPPSMKPHITAFFPSNARSLAQAKNESNKVESNRA